MTLFRSLILVASRLKFVEKTVRHGKLFKPTVSRFIAGDTLDEAMKVAEDLAEQGFHSSLDLLGENVATLEEAEKGAEAYIEIVERIGRSPFKKYINISIKLTALGLDQGDEVALKNYQKLLEAAKAHNIFIRADMEGSPYTERTIELVEKLQAEYGDLTGTVLQSYLYRTHADIDRLLKKRCRLRWVKGAYLEPESIAYQDKSDVDDQYITLGKKLLLKANFPALATHDENAIGQFKDFVKERGVSKGSFEWQMLFGIRNDLQRKLKEEGFQVRVYVPYGDSWYPYFSRRLAERPANMLFILKSLIKGK